MGGQKRIGKKGWFGAPGDPEVRQRRYPSLRQEFHSIGSVKMGTSRRERGAQKRPFLSSMGGGGILEEVAMVTPLAWDL